MDEPQFHYKIHLTAPATIRLDDPAPIPVQLEIMPLANKTSVSLEGVPMKIQVDEMQLIIHSQTHILVPGQKLEDRHERTCTDSTNLFLQKLFWELESPLVIDTDKPNEAINIGNMFQLALHSDGLTSGKRALFRSGRISPDFTTYSIKYTHTQEWTIGVTVAGERHKSAVSGPLKIIAAP